MIEIYKHIHFFKIYFKVLQLPNQIYGRMKQKRIQTMDATNH
jgi:hypothetical protein